MGHHEPQPYKTVNLIDKRVCSDCPADQLSPHLSPSPRASLSLRHRNIEIRPINNPTMAFQVKGKAMHLSPEIKTQKLLNLVRETETGQKASLLCQMPSCECKGNVLEKN